MNYALLLLTKLRAQQDRVRRLAAEGGWILGGQIASVAGALILVRVLTEYLTPAQYGELALGLTLAALVNQVVTGGLISGIARFFAPALEAENLARYLRASLRLVIVASLIILIFAIVLFSVLSTTGPINWLGSALATENNEIKYNTLTAGVSTAINDYGASTQIVDNTAADGSPCARLAPALPPLAQTGTPVNAAAAFEGPCGKHILSLCIDE